jgi:hypothetical protein
MDSWAIFGLVAAIIFISGCTQEYDPFASCRAECENSGGDFFYDSKWNDDPNSSFSCLAQPFTPEGCRCPNGLAYKAGEGCVKKGQAQLLCEQSGGRYTLANPFKRDGQCYCHPGKGFDSSKGCEWLTGPEFISHCQSFCNSSGGQLLSAEGICDSDCGKKATYCQCAEGMSFSCKEILSGGGCFGAAERNASSWCKPLCEGSGGRYVSGPPGRMGVTFNWCIPGNYMGGGCECDEPKIFDASNGCS